MSSKNKKERKKKKIRGRGTEIKEFQAIQQALLTQEYEEQKGGTPQQDSKKQSSSRSARQHLSPKLAELEGPYFAVNNVRYLERCGLCEWDITIYGRCTNPECGQEWGNPQELTDELVSEMIAKAKKQFQP